MGLKIGRYSSDGKLIETRDYVEGGAFRVDELGPDDHLITFGDDAQRPVRQVPYRPKEQKRPKVTINLSGDDECESITVLINGHKLTSLWTTYDCPEDNTVSRLGLGLFAEQIAVALGAEVDYTTEAEEE